MGQNEIILFAALIAGLASIIYGWAVTVWVLKKSAGSEKMQSISAAIQEGAMAYMNRQYRAVAVVAVIVFAIMWAAGLKSQFFGFMTAAGFLLGALLSACAGYVGMFVAVRANVRTAQAATGTLQDALTLAFKGGSVTGFLVAGLGLLAITIFYLITVYVFHQPVEYVMKSLIGLAFGGSLISVFARLGGGIYTKGADVGADLVGKVEAGIPEDDPRNPAVIADNVGDNVGDCAGMAADLFETFTVTTVATMVLGHTLYGEGPAVFYPLLLGAIAMVASIIGSFFAKLGASNNIMGALYKALGVSAFVAAIGFYPAAKWLMDGVVKNQAGQPLPAMNFFLTSLLGLVVTAGIIVITEYYTSKDYKPVKSIAKGSITGHATNIISGMAVMFKSTALPGVVISLGIFGSYLLGGLYGVGIAATAMLSMTGIVVAIDSFGPITDNAGGIAEMCHLGKDIREKTDALDAVGNTTKAVTKGYAIGSAALAAIVLFAEYTRAVGNGLTFDLSNPDVIVGLFLGGLLPFYFAALLAAL